MTVALRTAEGVYFPKTLRGIIFKIFPARGYTPYPLPFPTPGVGYFSLTVCTEGQKQDKWTILFQDISLNTYYISHQIVSN